MRGRTKKEIHKDIQDLDLLSLFPQKDARIMGGIERKGKLFKINNRGERMPNSFWLKEEEGVYIPPS
jgi:hypothetical protein